MCEIVQSAATSSAMSYESLVTIVLAAFAVILAALTLGIGLFAIWGYAGLKESVRDAVIKMATQTVTEKMELQLKAYPSAVEVQEIWQKINERADALGSLQSRVMASNTQAAVEGPPAPGIAIKPYPGGEELPDAGNTRATKDPGHGANAGPDNRKVPDPGPG